MLIMKIRISNSIPEKIIIIFKWGNGYLENDIKIRKADNGNCSVALIGGVANDLIRLVNNALAYAIHDARISTSAGVEIEQKKIFSPISTNMRLVTLKDGDFL